MAAAPTAIPPALSELLRRCLEKDLRRRFHDISDVRIALEDAAIEPFRAVAPPRQPPRLAWIAVALFGAATGAAIVATVRVTTASAAPGHHHGRADSTSRLAVLAEPERCALT